MISRVLFKAEKTTVITTKSGEPNWLYIPTAGRCKKTKEQLVFEIKELANRAANAKEGIEEEHINREVLKLRADYLSDVSPNRKELYHQAENVIKSHDGNKKGALHGMGEMSLLYFLEHATGNQNLSDISYTLAGGAALTFPIMTGGGYGVVIEKAGVKIMNGDNVVGWSYEMTQAELQKKDEFYSIYYNALKNAKKGFVDNLRDLPDYLEEKSSFDSFA